MKTKEIIRGSILMICTVALFSMTGCTQLMNEYKEKRQRGADHSAWINWDKAPIVNSVDEFLQVETGMTKNEVLEILNKNEHYLASGEFSDGRASYTMDVESYKADVPYHVEIIYDFSAYGGRVCVMKYIIEEPSSDSLGISLETTGLLTSEEVRNCFKLHFPDAEEKYGATGYDHSDYVLTQENGNIGRWRLLAQCYGYGDTRIEIRDEVISTPKENTSDGEVGDNNGNGRIDEEDWEQEWKDYVNKKMDEN